MRDRELYATIPGLAAPWTVERVEVDLAGEAVHVRLEREAGAAVTCPACQTPQRIYDHREREWRHLDTCQLQTRLHARVPRVDCPTHGVRQIAVPWATPGSPFTALFERLVLDWLRGGGAGGGAPPAPELGHDVGHHAARRRREGLPAPAQVRDRGD